MESLQVRCRRWSYCSFGANHALRKNFRKGTRIPLQVDKSLSILSNLQGSERGGITPRTKLKLLILVPCGNSSALIRTDLCLGVYGVKGCVLEIMFRKMDNFCPGDASLPGRICRRKARSRVTLGPAGPADRRTGRQTGQLTRERPCVCSCCDCRSVRRTDRPGRQTCEQ